MSEILTDAIRYWETRRISYNAVLTIVVILWIVVTWPHFKPAFTFPSFLFLVVAAVLANLCYSAAYVADIPMQLSAFRPTWRRWRWGLWLFGMLFALLIESYWIGDEIYPFVLTGP